VVAFSKSSVEGLKPVMLGVEARSYWKVQLPGPSGAVHAVGMLLTCMLMVWGLPAGTLRSSAGMGPKKMSVVPFVSRVTPALRLSPARRDKV